MNLTDVLIEVLFDMGSGRIPEDVYYEAQKCLLDYLGTVLAGTVMLKEKTDAYLDFYSNEHGVATVIGMQRKASLHNTAFVNSMNAHITELDDGHRYCNAHLGATIIPAILAVAESEKLSKRDVLRGIIIGYEAAIRLGRAIQPSHKNRGYHVSGTCGTIGAAVGVGTALGFTKQQIKNAISSAATSAAGILEVLEGESELKPYNIARASLDGLTAAYTARAGFQGPDDIVGGKRGFFNVMSDKYDVSGLSETGENSYNIKKIYRKPYAACRHCHPAIEAAINIREVNNITGGEVKEINVKTYQLAVFGHDHTDIRGITSAKMSIPFSVAVALKTGKADILSFMQENVEDPQILELTKKVKVHADDELSALVPDKRAAAVDVLTNNGCSFSARVDYPRGEPENPMSADEIEEKFIALSLYGGKTESEARRIIKQVMDIEGNLSDLIAFLY